jgi:leucyl aminopeptidase
MPANLCTADRYEQDIVAKFREFKNAVKITILHKPELIKKKMELILGVGKASPKEN